MALVDEQGDYHNSIPTVSELGKLCRTTMFNFSK